MLQFRSEPAVPCTEVHLMTQQHGHRPRPCFSALVMTPIVHVATIVDCARWDPVHLLGMLPMTEALGKCTPQASTRLLALTSATSCGAETKALTTCLKTLCLIIRHQSQTPRTCVAWVHQQLLKGDEACLSQSQHRFRIPRETPPE